MREIVFKAKRIDNGEWVYWNIFGELCRKSGKGTRLAIQKGATISYYDYIHQIRQFISIDTICRCTGLTDKNGKKIWENDVVKKHFYTDYDAYANSEEYVGIVEFTDCAWVIKTKNANRECSRPIIESLAYSHDVEYFEVIGNIFDNPELLSNRTEF